MRSFTLLNKYRLFPNTCLTFLRNLVHINMLQDRIQAYPIKKQTNHNDADFLKLIDI